MGAPSRASRLRFQPGTQWLFHAGTDLLSRVVEIVSAQPFAEFSSSGSSRRGMSHTTFWVSRSRKRGGRTPTARRQGREARRNADLLHVWRAVTDATRPAMGRAVSLDSEDVAIHQMMLRRGGPAAGRSESRDRAS